MEWNLVFLAAAFFVGLWSIQGVISVWRVQKILGDCPGGEILWVHPFRVLSIVVGSFFPFKGQIGHYFSRFDQYRSYGSTILSSVVFSGAIPIFWLADAEAIKIVSTERSLFPKDVAAYEALNIYGPSILGTEGSDWKRHRNVAKPAFNEANTSYVWSETVRVLNEWFSHLDTTQAGKSDITINLVKDMTQVTLLVISSAGFGRKVSWSDDLKMDALAGHTMSFRQAVTSAIDNVFVKVLTPSWLYRLSQGVRIPIISKAMRNAQRSFDALRGHMQDVVEHARADHISGISRTDAALLKNLVGANMAELGTLKSLSDDELLSNTFNFLLAGHETSAHTLSYAVTMLALYPEVQAKVYEEAMRLWPDGFPEESSSTTFSQSFLRLTYTTAVFHETLRMFPAIIRLGKPVQRDTTLPGYRFQPATSDKLSTNIQDPQRFTVNIPVGSVVIIDIFGVHRNPIHWGADADSFKPERFIDTDNYRWPRDAFLAFSAGPRSCIGQRFSTVESTCILASLVLKYQILIPDDLKSLPRLEQERILLDTTPQVTLTPNNARVQLKRRA
ncbi:hypothetical protein HGRIS_011300 [Hohenbuehelia grisea]|uniref:Cytochrome P450 n=1 Tax=Hohenbuehelia grisea TaxID=104357 RepID=A0ABR3JWV5_9AGAR